MAATVDQVLAVAASQIGTNYASGTATKYGVWYGIPTGQWCAMSLSWIFDQAGALDIFPKHAYTPTGAAAFKARGQWTAGTSGLRRGDVVFFDFPGAPDRISHVGIVEKVLGTNRFQTLEGNTSGTVNGDQRNGGVYARKIRTSAYIVGYGRPPYATASTAVPVPASKQLVAGSALQLKVDGSRGPATITTWQTVMGTPPDGVISTPESSVIRADQAFLNANVASGHILALTGKPALDTDGDEGWRTIKVRQFWLFNRLAPQVLGRTIRPDLTDITGELNAETTRLHQTALNQATIGSGIY